MSTDSVDMEATYNENTEDKMDVQQSSPDEKLDLAVSSNSPPEVTESSSSPPENVNKSCDSNESESVKTVFKAPILPQKRTSVASNHDQETGASHSNDSSNDVELDSETIKSSHSKSSLSPAELIKQQQVPVPYKEPSWAGLPDTKYTFEVLKEGIIKDTINLSTKSFHIFGRLKGCDVQMEHPSLSRYHAVVQYCAVPNDKHEVGWYLYDLDSTHGTWINKNQVKPNIYYRIRVGYVVKFGGSTRLHILQGPEEDEEEESDLSVTEMKAQREQKAREAEIARLAEEQVEKTEDLETDTGCAWGMQDDAIEEEATFQMSETPQHEHLYVDDPKKALKNFYEREGWDLPDYQLFDSGFGKHRCVVELPLDTPAGEPLCAEVTVSGKRKEAVLACALEACRMLDKMGELTKSHQESRKKKTKNWEDNDFYDSDDDEFLDRTGLIEQKRIMRMKKAGKMEEKAESYESLSKKWEAVKEEIQGIENSLEEAKADSAKLDLSDIDALDAYMSAIKGGAMDTKTRMKLKRQLFDLRKEEQRLQRLVNIARPANLPSIKKSISLPTKSAPMFGKIRGRQKPLKLIPPPTAKPQPVSKDYGSGEEEEEEEDEEEGKEENTNREEKSEKPEQSMEDTTSDKTASVKTESELNKSDKGYHKAKDSSHSDDDKLKKNVFSENIDMDVSKSKVDTSAKLQADKSELSGTTTKSESSRDSQPETRPPEKRELEPTFAAPKPSSKKRPGNESTAETLKKLKKKGPQLPQDYDPSDPDYAVWLPPKNQTGDGRTHLNEKYGY